MLHHTRACRVVFTQAYPVLQLFATRHFLPTHPLSTSPLWLTEYDVNQIQKYSHGKGRPNPLRIDVLAHHPTLSRYAGNNIIQSKSSTTARQRGKRTLVERETCNARSKAHLSSADAQADSSTSVRGVGDAAQPSFSAKSAFCYRPPICSTVVYSHVYYLNLEQVCRTPKVRHVPNRISALHAQEEMEQGRKELLSQFPTPCELRGMLSINPGKRDKLSALVQAELYRLYRHHNYLSPWWGTESQWRSLSAQRLPDEEPHCVARPHETKLIHLSLIKDAERVLRRCYISAKTGRMIHNFDDSCCAMGEGSAALCARTGEVGERVSWQSSEERDGLAWGVSAQPSRKYPSASYSSMSTHVHNSSNDANNTSSSTYIHDNHREDATYCSGYTDRSRNGCHFSQSGASSGEDDAGVAETFFDAVRRDMREHDYTIPLYFSGRQIQHCGLTLRANASCIVPAQRNRKEQEQQLFSSSPLSVLQAIEHLSEADGIDRSEYDALSLLPHHPMSDACQETTTSQSCSASRTRTAMQNSSSSGHAPCRARYITRSNTSATLVPSMVPRMHYYHISQITFPPHFYLSQRVVAATRQYPQKPIHGLTGQRLKMRGLSLESLLHVAPELASRIAHVSIPKASENIPKHTVPTTETSNTNDTHETDIGDTRNSEYDARSSCSGKDKGKYNNGPNEVRPAAGTAATLPCAEEQKVTELRALPVASDAPDAKTSPLHCLHQSIWFLAEDIIAKGGAVDANTAPVEVEVNVNTRTGCDDDDESGSVDSALLNDVNTRALYNVHALEDPDKGFQVVNCPLPSLANPLP